MTCDFMPFKPYQDILMTMKGCVQWNLGWNEFRLKRGFTARSVDVRLPGVRLAACEKDVYYRVIPVHWCDSLSLSISCQNVSFYLSNFSIFYHYDIVTLVGKF